MDPLIVGYRRLHKEAKRWKGKQPQIPDLRLLPASKQCNRKTGLNVGGIPVLCRNPGYVQLGKVVFCEECFKRFQKGS